MAQLLNYVLAFTLAAQMAGGQRHQSGLWMWGTCNTEAGIMGLR